MRSMRILPSGFLDMASFVDPRFRDTYIQRDRVAAVKQKVVAEAKALLPEESSEPTPSLLPADQEAPVGPPAAKKRSLASFFKQSTVTSHNTLTQQERTENELFAINKLFAIS